jgi:hypothetical protein
METATKPTVKINELREGNLVLEHGILHKISWKDADQWHLDSFEPIPLTPELLEKCGFRDGYKGRSNSDDWYYYINIRRYYFSLYKYSHNKGRVICQFSAARILNPPQYLHQLQNLYFALTGTELEINL